MADPRTPPKPEPKPMESEFLRVLDAQQLLQGSKEVCIEHAGVRYRLRVTRRNKLILQK
jgi:hemin uptake protein HemP